MSAADLARRILAVERCLGAVPEVDLAEIFDESFFAQLPQPQLELLLQHLRSEYGLCIGHRVLAEPSAHTAQVRWEFERGYHMEGRIALGAQPPHKVVLLNFGMPSRSADTWEAIEQEARALPGQTSFVVRRLDEPRLLASANAELRLGIGSTSKLVLFSSLVDCIAAGARRWDDLVVLHHDNRSAPTGILHTWPEGSPLTLHTAAVLLLSQSDNTAADLLLRLLGRERVEEVARSAGLGDDGRNRPFLSTRAVFRLVAAGPEAARAYVEADEGERRRRLEELESEPPRAESQTTEPWPEGIGWYASAAEVAALLDRLHRQVRGSPVAKAILGMSPNGIASSRWRFVGYKGGSSPGRLSLAALLEDEGGAGVGVCLINAAPPAGQSLEACARLVKRATDLALAELGRGTGSER